MRQRRPVAVDDAEEVDLPDAPQLLRLELLDLGVDGHDRVGDIGVDASEALDGGLDDALNLRLVADVARNRERLRAGAFDLGDAVVERLRVAGGHDDLRTALSGPARDRAPQAARGACHDDYLLA